jgi:hypothetical protein
MIDWNDTTAKQEKAAVKKFRELGITVTLGQYSTGASHQYTWAELVNITSNFVKDSDIISKMLKTNSLIATRPNDEVLGKFLFTTVNDELLDEPAEVTYDELYIYLRAALKLRRSKREAIQIDAAIEKAQATVDASKTAKEKRADAKAELAELLIRKEQLKG